ncbi:MAG: hydrolase, partial [Waddliaceae bacterium]|nr:hydrolase [Waddliaceae bacterium]
YHIQSGFIRTRYRESFESPSFLEEGVVYAIEVPMKSAAHTFKKGHCIQLLISSSDFPHHSRNLNTGADNEETSHYVTAKQTIFYGGDYDSHILLSVISDQ